METQIKRSIHPLLTIAAVSVTLFSVAGIAAIMGWIPTSSSHAPATAAEASQPRLADAAIEPIHPRQRSIDSKPAAKPKPSMKETEQAGDRHAATRPATHSYPPLAQAEPRDPPALPEYHPAPPRELRAESPRKHCDNCGVVEDVREIDTPGAGSGLGAVAGGVLGSVLGHQLGNGRGRTVMTVVGAAGGALAGHQVEKSINKSHIYELTIRFEDGTSRVIRQDSAPPWRAGDRVKVENNTIQPNA